MAKELLSDAECKNAKTNGKKLLKLVDGEGLYLWVYEDGRKYWRFRYFLAGKEKSLSIGVYPKVSLKAARDKCEVERKRLESSLDPSAERKADKIRIANEASNSFESVAREWHGKNSHTWSEHYKQEVINRLSNNVFPVIGARPIAKIDAPELLAMLRKIEERGSYHLAHRVIQHCGQVFRYGIATARCTRDISADLRGALTPHVKQHQAAIKPEEPPELLKAIGAYETIGDRQTRLALQLLAHTFVRTNELIGSEWSEFNLASAIWIIPAERMKMKTEHVVPLSTQAVDMLGELKELSGDGKFVFQGKNPNRTMSNNTMLFALYRLGYRSRMTGHGFRAVASTVLNESGFRADVIERQLAHCERNSVRGAYNRAEYFQERKDMMQWWSNHLEALTNGAKVVPFKKAVK